MSSQIGLVCPKCGNTAFDVLDFHKHIHKCTDCDWKGIPKEMHWMRTPLSGKFVLHEIFYAPESLEVGE